MANTKKILTSVHGRRLGLSSDKQLVIEGNTVLAQNDGGAIVNIARPAPTTKTATNTMTIADLLNGLIVGTPAGAANYTLPTGTLTDAGLGIGVDQAFQWGIVNAHATNVITVVASAGHTIVGGAAVAGASSVSFQTRKTAANTFVTYRVG